MSCPGTEELLGLLDSPLDGGPPEQASRRSGAFAGAAGELAEAGHTDDSPSAHRQAHVAQCAACAAALDGLRRVRALARVVGGASRRPQVLRQPRGKAARRLARAMSTMAAAALFAALGAEPVLRRRIDRAEGVGEAPPAVHAGAAVFWTSASLATRVGR